MILSMTGFGRSQRSAAGVAVVAEVRSVNNRFLDLGVRIPRSLSHRENDIKEIVRKRLARGKVSLTLTLEADGDADRAMTVNVAAARSAHDELKKLRSALRLRDPITLEHILQFPDVLKTNETAEADDQTWGLCREAVENAVDALILMRRNEGAELHRDFTARVRLMESRLDEIERLAKDQVPQERDRLRERLKQILEGASVDESRLEMEIAMLADRVDITEECVRFRSHTKFFLEAMDDPEPAGRKLNFLAQELNREANTIGSKCSSSTMAQLVVGIKEELEKIREQLQNIE